MGRGERKGQHDDVHVYGVWGGDDGGCVEMGCCPVGMWAVLVLYVVMHHPDHVHSHHTHAVAMAHVEAVIAHVVDVCVCVLHPPHHHCCVVTRHDTHDDWMGCMLRGGVSDVLL